MNLNIFLMKTVETEGIDIMKSEYPKRVLLNVSTMLAAAVVMIGLLSGCNGKEDALEEVIDQIILPVSATHVVKGNIEKFLTYTGNVDAAKRVEIAPLAPGRIVRIMVDEGDRVKKGQVLVKMDDMAVAPEIYRRAKELGIGTWLPL